MKRFLLCKRIFLLLAVLLSDAMCASVAYCYCNLQWGARYEGFSAPANVAFLLAIPYAVGIVACLLLAWQFHKKAKTTGQG